MSFPPYSRHTRTLKLRSGGELVLLANFNPLTASEDDLNLVHFLAEQFNFYEQPQKEETPHE